MHYSLPNMKRKRPKWLLHIVKMTLKYHIIHFHWSSFLLNRLDFPLLKVMDKRVIMHFHGNEIRGKVTPILLDLADHTFVSTHDLLAYVHDAVWIPNPVPDRVFGKK